MSKISKIAEISSCENTDFCSTLVSKALYLPRSTETGSIHRKVSTHHLFSKR